MIIRIASTPIRTWFSTKRSVTNLSLASVFTPTGALLLVSDQPMIPEGVKTEASDKLVTERFVEDHVRIGIDAMRVIIEEKRTVKHLKYEW